MSTDKRKSRDEDFDGHHKLEVLELRFNKIKSLKGLQKSIALREVYLA